MIIHTKQQISTVHTKQQTSIDKKSVTTTISFEQVLPQILLEELEENGITDSINEIPVAIDSAYVKKGVLYIDISSTIYP